MLKILFLFYSSLFVLFSLNNGYIIDSSQWIAPFNKSSKLRMLCININEQWIMREGENPLVNNLIRHSIMCNSKYKILLKTKKYEGLVWLMQSLAFCSIFESTQKKHPFGGRSPEFHRDFQMNFLKAAFAIVCKRTDYIGRYHLSFYAEVFKILYERNNSNRKEVCDRMVLQEADLFKRCQVIDKDEEEKQNEIEQFRKNCIEQNSKKDAGPNMTKTEWWTTTVLTSNNFFTRFSQLCEGRPRYTFDQFIEINSKSNEGMGQALANDFLFMNGISNFLKAKIKKRSLLPYLVMKTRLLLQHFPLASIWVAPKIEKAYRCKILATNEQFQEDYNSTEINNNNENNSFNYLNNTIINLNNSFIGGFNEDNNNNNNEPVIYEWKSEDHQFYAENCPNADGGFTDEYLNEETVNDFSWLSSQARIGLAIEICLLLGIVFNTTILSSLLYQIRHQLSTATILFIFNILFSNVLFVASFVCLFSNMFSDSDYQQEKLEEDQQTTSTSTDDDERPPSAALYIGELLQHHLFKPSEFLKNLLQETLLSLAQNGSLLGLTHLLVLVLLVIKRSMEGKGIRLSRSYVICLFSCVWLILIISHVSFSALQYFAVSELHRLLNQLKTTVGFYLCNRNDRYSVFKEIGERCDSISVFHDFGHFLLRGHTLFTLFFLFVSIAIFLATIFCHWRVNLQHEMLSRNTRSGRKREHSPYRRRETLFNTLLLSLGAFFISVSGQSFVEIAVFWVSDRRDLTRLAAVYQLFRIAAFIDPLLNPLLVALRYYLYLTTTLFCKTFCPCLTSKLISKRRIGRDSVVIAKRKRQSSSLPITVRRGSSGSYLSWNDSENGISKFGCICSGRIIRNKFNRKDSGATQVNSVI